MSSPNFTEKQRDFIVNMKRTKGESMTNQFLKKFPNWVKNNWNPRELWYKDLPDNDPVKLNYINETIRSFRKRERDKSKPKEEIHRYDDSAKKRIVQANIFKLIKQDGLYNKSNALTLLGPTPEPYVKEISDFIGIDNEIVSYETDLKVFEEQIEKYNNDSRFNLKFGNILDAEEIPNFVDLDLMCFYSSCEDKIDKMFKKQHQNTSQRNIFLLTTCVDRIDEKKVNKEITKCISNLLGRKVTYNMANDKFFYRTKDNDIIYETKKYKSKKKAEEEGVKLLNDIDGNPIRGYIYECQFKNTGNYEVKAYRYRDSMLMFSVVIKYKMGKKSVVKW